MVSSLYYYRSNALFRAYKNYLIRTESSRLILFLTFLIRRPFNFICLLNHLFIIIIISYKFSTFRIITERFTLITSLLGKICNGCVSISISWSPSPKWHINNNSNTKNIHNIRYDDTGPIDDMSSIFWIWSYMVGCHIYDSIIPKWGCDCWLFGQWIRYCTKFFGNYFRYGKYILFNRWLSLYIHGWIINKWWKCKCSSCLFCTQKENVFLIEFLFSFLFFFSKLMASGKLCLAF